MNFAGSAFFLWNPIEASARAGATQVVRKFGMAAVPPPFLAAAVTATSSFIVSILTLWYVEKSQETWKMNRQCFWWFLAAGITISLGMTADVVEVKRDAMEIGHRGLSADSFKTEQNAL